ncbi:gag-like protein [Vespula maculifrons]|uniref:Gag-like protein n=1 Tax=Vespula maculifrons TaxID=7453 RepID=A0ABD2CPW2_VESMC
MVTLTANIQMNLLQQTKQSLLYVPNMGTWGYIIAYCYADSTYLKDAQKYVTKESKKSLTEPTKCVNCREAHPANATLCKEYVTRGCQGI